MAIFTPAWGAGQYGRRLAKTSADRSRLLPTRALANKKRRPLDHFTPHHRIHIIPSRLAYASHAASGAYGHVWEIREEFNLYNDMCTRGIEVVCSVCMQYDWYINHRLASKSTTAIPSVLSAWFQNQMTGLREGRVWSSQSADRTSTGYGCQSYSMFAVEVRSSRTASGRSLSTPRPNRVFIQRAVSVFLPN